MRRPKGGSWTYLVRQLDRRLKQTDALSAYLNEHNVLFWLKDIKAIVQRVENGPPFTPESLPDTVAQEHRHKVSELLNDLMVYYEKERRKREKRERLLDAERQRIPEDERARLRWILDEYKLCLRSDDKRLARLASITSINKWLDMLSSERKQWFQRVEGYARHLKRATRESDRQFEEDWRRWEQQWKHRRSNSYQKTIVTPDPRRIQAYRTLGVSQTATPDEVKRAWKHLVLKHHPDRGGNLDTFIQIQKAYELIGV